MMYAPVVLLLSLTAGVSVTCVGEDGDLADRLARLETLLAAQDHRLNTVERENQQLKLTNLELKADNEKLKTDAGNLQAENQELRDGYRTLSQKVADLQAALPKSSHDQRHSEKKKVHELTARSDDTNAMEAVVAQLGQQVTAVKADVQVLQNSVQQAGISVYTRWGHSACPASNQLVYSGVVGGSSYEYTGSAVNYLCLTLSPVPGSPPDNGHHALLYGGEYETYDGHQNRDPVCAVCRSPRPSTIMVPGTNRCMSGWTLEYSGYLMAGRDIHAAATEYVCVDSAMLSRSGGNENLDGVLFYYTIAQCGSLPCEPYVHGNVVTCAVCSH